MSKNKVAYLCKGCGLGEAFDFEAFEEALGDENISEVKELEVACSPEGVAAIQADIDNDGVNAVLIGACSARFKTAEFDFGSDVLVARAPIREMALWCSDDEAREEPGDDSELEGSDMQLLAEDYLRISAVKLDKSSFKEPFQLEGDVSKGILVVGGGPSGMSAALAAAEAGQAVYLVEKEEALGGFLNKLAKLAPETNPYQQLEDVDVSDLVAKIEASDKIKVFTGATVAKTSGGPGAFDIDLSSGDSFKVGAVIQATGWVPYDPQNLAEDLKYGSSPDIITNVDFEAMAKAGQIKRPSDGAPVQSVAFIQCAGSRDDKHLPYCSAFCCGVSIKQAMLAKQQNPDASVYVIYKDIRTPGVAEESYRQAQSMGVIFIRRPEDQYPDIAPQGSKLAIETKDVLVNDTLSIEELDMVVLATGMKPNNPKVVEAPLAAFGADQEEIKAAAKAAAAACEEWSVLNLDYRQGCNMPTLKYGMPDSHFICFPYESRRTGIYTAGTVRRPMRQAQAREDGVGAAMKAIQAVYGAETGSAVHPRSGDISFPSFQMSRCTQCKRCTEECPFGAINEDEKANPLPNVTRCRRCGTCMGACPERIISFSNYSVEMIGEMIKSIQVPEEEEEKPRVVVLACENDAIPALEMAAKKGIKWSPHVRFIPVRCLGSVNLVWVADALSSGIDGLILMGCRRGDDYQCHFVRGSELANVRMSKVSETLDRLTLESDRVRVEEVGINDWNKVKGMIDDFMEVIEEVGPNPYKGF